MTHTESYAKFNDSSFYGSGYGVAQVSSFHTDDVDIHAQNNLAPSNLILLGDVLQHHALDVIPEDIIPSFNPIPFALRQLNLDVPTNDDETFFTWVDNHCPDIFLSDPSLNSQQDHPNHCDVDQLLALVTSGVSHIPPPQPQADMNVSGLPLIDTSPPQTPPTPNSPEKHHPLANIGPLEKVFMKAKVDPYELPPVVHHTHLHPSIPRPLTRTQMQAEFEKAYSLLQSDTKKSKFNPLSQNNFKLKFTDAPDDYVSSKKFSPLSTVSVSEDSLVQDPPRSGSNINQRLSNAEEEVESNMNNEGSERNFWTESNSNYQRIKKYIPTKSESSISSRVSNYYCSDVKTNSLSLSCPVSSPNQPTVVNNGLKMRSQLKNHFNNNTETRSENGNHRGITVLDVVNSLVGADISEIAKDFKTLFSFNNPSIKDEPHSKSSSTLSFNSLFFPSQSISSNISVNRQEIDSSVSLIDNALLPTISNHNLVPGQNNSQSTNNTLHKNNIELQKQINQQPFSKPSIQKTSEVGINLLNSKKINFLPQQSSQITKLCPSQNATVKSFATDILPIPPPAFALSPLDSNSPLPSANPSSVVSSNFSPPLTPSITTNTSTDVLSLNSNIKTNSVLSRSREGNMERKNQTDRNPENDKIPTARETTMENPKNKINKNDIKSFTDIFSEQLRILLKNQPSPRHLTALQTINNKIRSHNNLNYNSPKPQLPTFSSKPHQRVSMRPVRTPSPSRRSPASPSFVANHSVDPHLSPSICSEVSFGTAAVAVHRIKVDLELDSVDSFVSSQSSSDVSSSSCWRGGIVSDFFDDLAELDGLEAPSAVNTKRTNLIFDNSVKQKKNISISDLMGNNGNEINRENASLNLQPVDIMSKRYVKGRNINEEEQQQQQSIPSVRVRPSLSSSQTASSSLIHSISSASSQNSKKRHNIVEDGSGDSVISSNGEASDEDDNVQRQERLNLWIGRQQLETQDNDYTTAVPLGTSLKRNNELVHGNNSMLSVQLNSSVSSSSTTNSVNNTKDLLSSSHSSGKQNLKSSSSNCGAKLVKRLAFSCRKSLKSKQNGVVEFNSSNQSLTTSSSDSMTKSTSFHGNSQNLNNSEPYVKLQGNSSSSALENNAVNGSKLRTIDKNQSVN